jgi:hypothetical protein
MLLIALCGTMRHWIDARNPYAGPRQAAAAQEAPVSARLTAEELFSRLHQRRDWQHSHLSEFSVLRTYTVRDGKGAAVAQEVVTMKYIPPGMKAFTVVSVQGSRFVRTHVFQPLMAREAARTRTQSDSDALITPENYKFQITGNEQVGGYECIVVHAVPIHRRSDLFDGEIWIDRQAFAIVQIKGHLAKSPSFWVKRVEFERQYEKVSEFFVPLRETAAANIRIYGKRTLTVNDREYAFGDSHTAERGTPRFAPEGCSLLPGTSAASEPKSPLDFLPRMDQRSVFRSSSDDSQRPFRGLSGFPAGAKPMQFILYTTLGSATC